MDNIYQVLLERGYEEKHAKTVLQSLYEIDDSLRQCLEAWILLGEESDFEVNGMSLLSIKARFGMRYPAALLAMDWIIKDPQTAMEAIKKGVK